MGGFACFACRVAGSIALVTPGLFAPRSSRMGGFACFACRVAGNIALVTPGLFAPGSRGKTFVSVKRP